MIYTVIYFNGKDWVEFISFTVEEYAMNFAMKMKKEYPDLDVTIKGKFPSRYELAFAFSVDIAESTTF